MIRLAMHHAAVVGTWGEPVAEPVPGFIESAFNPTAFELCRKLMSTDDARPDATGIVLASLHGDTTTADVASLRLLAGKRRNPLLFYQSVPSSILGYASAMFGITGPMITLSADEGVFEQSLRLSSVLLGDTTLRSILLLGIAVPATERAQALYRMRGYELPPDAPDAYGFALELRAPPPGERVDASPSAVLVCAREGVEIEHSASDGRRTPLGQGIEPGILDVLPPDMRGFSAACAAFDHSYVHLGQDWLEEGSRR